MDIHESAKPKMRREPWNKSKLIGQKPPLRPKHVWAIRTKLQMACRTRDLAMFNLATASCVAVTSSRLGSKMSRRAGTRSIERPFDRRRPHSPSGSN
jgi:hypothetical protein